MNEKAKIWHSWKIACKRLYDPNGEFCRSLGPSWQRRVPFHATDWCCEPGVFCQCWARWTRSTGRYAPAYTDGLVRPEGREPDLPCESKTKRMVGRPVIRVQECPDFSRSKSRTGQLGLHNRPAEPVGPSSPSSHLPSERDPSVFAGTVRRETTSL